MIQKEANIHCVITARALPAGDFRLMWDQLGIWLIVFVLPLLNVCQQREMGE